MGQKMVGYLPANLWQAGMRRFLKLGHYPKIGCISLRIKLN
jgi:hypothetical protein